MTAGDFPEGSFNLIHVRWVFSHLPDREAVLAKAVRWLAPGGWILGNGIGSIVLCGSELGVSAQYNVTAGRHLSA